MIEDTRIESLRKEYGAPSERSSKKAVNFLSEEVKQFIKNSPFAVLSSCDRSGNCDASPRGGRPGFVKILSDNKLFIPDIKGNRLFQSFGNFESNPKAGMIFFIPGNDRMVRVNGRVSILSKAEVSKIVELEVFVEDENSELIQGFSLEVDEAYSHCPRSLKFADLWNTETIEANRK